MLSIRWLGDMEITLFYYYFLSPLSLSFSLEIFFFFFSVMYMLSRVRYYLLNLCTIVCARARTPSSYACVYIRARLTWLIPRDLLTIGIPATPPPVSCYIFFFFFSLLLWIYMLRGDQIRSYFFLLFFLLSPFAFLIFFLSLSLLLSYV